MPPVAAASIAGAFLFDLAFREFPERWHPVVAYGAVLGWIDRDWAAPRLVGTVAAVGLPITAALAIGVLTAIAGHVHAAAVVAVVSGVLFAATSRRLLIDTARQVIELSADDPARARERLPALVGRDPAALSAAEIRSAAVESAAENLADGLVAPLLAFVVFAWWLPLAAGAAAFVKAVNTGDSMFGYRSHPLGWAFARVDDLVMWIPARLSAALVAVLAANPSVVRQAVRWAPETDSPNAGWPMAAVAAAIETRLEKPGAYVLNPDAALPTVAQAQEGVRLVNRAGVLAFAGAAVAAWY
ncbi:MAG: CobD/CbiB family cobalamin biosynthesis protein [Halobacteriales archaeon]